jgi:hypothetical protein
MRDQLNGWSRGNIVEVDLAGVVLLSARGISALVAASRSAAQQGVVFRVRACHPIARRVIDIVGVTELLGFPPMGRYPNLAHVRPADRMPPLHPFGSPLASSLP